MRRRWCVAIILRQAQGASTRYLLGKRHPSKRVAPAYWCPVTGRIEEGETEQEAVVREALEEVGLRVVPSHRLCTTITRDGSAQIHWWVTRIVEGDANMTNDEHTEIRWVTEEMKALSPIFEEDVVIYEQLERGESGHPPSSKRR